MKEHQYVAGYLEEYLYFFKMSVRASSIRIFRGFPLSIAKCLICLISSGLILTPNGFLCIMFFGLTIRIIIFAFMVSCQYKNILT